jgi:prepilin-type N-terminal cleavage/methylation domain-containing protein
MSLTGQSGFSLLEVLIAAILLACVTTATTSLTLVSGHELSRAAHASAAQGIGASQLERWRSLPFVAPSPTDAASAVPSVVDELFPHAIVARNREDAYVSARTHDRAATFTTRSVVGEVTVTDEAMFVRSAAAGWRPVPWSAIAGFAADQAAVLPADALLVKVTVRWPNGASSHAYTLEAVVVGSPQVRNCDGSSVPGI